MNKNTLMIVGSGIKFMSHLTIEAKACIEKADKVLYLVNEPAMQSWIQDVNKSSESLDFLYNKNDYREDNYRIISDYIIENLKKIKHLCVVMYGHPTVFAKSTLYAAQLAKEHGHNVIVMPGVSAEDCLFADLLIDPSSSGCQSFDATDFLLNQREYDLSCHLILWQVNVIGLLTKPINHNPEKGLQILSDYLSEKYSLNHEIIIYEAAQYPMLSCRIDKVNLVDLPKAEVTNLSTLYIPPASEKKSNLSMLKKLKSIT